MVLKCSKVLLHLSSPYISPKKKINKFVAKREGLKIEGQR